MGRSFAEVSEFAEEPVVGGPVGFDFDPEGEAAGFAEDGFEFFFGGAADGAELAALGAEEDGALGGFFDV